MTSTSDQKISDSMPSMWPGVTAMFGPGEAGRNRVQRTGADVAEHHAEGRNRHRRQTCHSSCCSTDMFMFLVT